MKVSKVWRCLNDLTGHASVNRRWFFPLCLRACTCLKRLNPAGKKLMTLGNVCVRWYWSNASKLSRTYGREEKQQLSRLRLVDTARFCRSIFLQSCNSISFGFFFGILYSHLDTLSADSNDVSFFITHVRGEGKEYVFVDLLHQVK